MQITRPRNVLILTALVLLASAVSQGAIVTGTNPVLAAHGNQFYIPLKASSSGVLGTNGVGLSSDSVRLQNSDSDSGWVDFKITFDLSSVLGPNEIIDQSVPMRLKLKFNDIDFKPVVSRSSGLEITFRESLGMTFLRDVGDAPTGVDILLATDNYMTYKTNPGSATNNTLATYSLDLAPTFALSQADIDDMNCDKEFALALRFRSHSRSKDLWRWWNNCVTLCNTPESLAEGFQFEFVTTSQPPVPEPCTLAMVALGGVGVVLRKPNK